MDRFESDAQSTELKNAKKHLHSNMDRFERISNNFNFQEKNNLHSNMDRFESHSALIV